MFKLAIFAAILAVAFAAPGGLTGLTLNSGLGPIVSPAVVSAGPALGLGGLGGLGGYGGHVIAQPIAPVVHSPAIVTRTVLAGHGIGGYGIGGYGIGLHG